MVLFHIPRPASNVESQATDKWYLKTAFVRYVQPMNVSLVSWSRHPPGSLREREREWTILRLHQRTFPVFGLILYLRGGHDYSLKHGSSLFKKRNLCHDKRNSCFNWSIRVETKRQELLGVAKEVQSWRGCMNWLPLCVSVTKKLSSFQTIWNVTFESNGMWLSLVDQNKYECGWERNTINSCWGAAP